MPTYEYRCANGHTFEQFQKISDPPVASCPECDAAVERVLSGGAGLLFKGSGFYITDYRSDTYKKAAESEGGGKPADKPAEKAAAPARGKAGPPASGGTAG
jgi:putative FmdB family regulatory protein